MNESDRHYTVEFMFVLRKLGIMDVEAGRRFLDELYHGYMR